MTKAMRLYLVLSTLALGAHWGGGKAGWFKGMGSYSAMDMRGGGGGGSGFGGGGFRGGK